VQFQFTQTEKMRMTRLRSGFGVAGEARMSNECRKSAVRHRRQQELSTALENAIFSGAVNPAKHFEAATISSAYLNCVSLGQPLLLSGRGK
jgi:hypothetical protein